MSPIERDVCILDGDGTAGIVVAGDSRAKYSLIPSILAEEMGRKCINIAEPITMGGDISTLVKVLRRNPQVLANHPILILSVNLESLNDLGYTGTPVATLWDWSPLDHFRVFLHQPRTYLKYFVREFLPSIKTLTMHKWKGELFHCSEGIYQPPGLLTYQGYEPLQGRKDEKELYRWPSDEQRYLLNGGRWKAYEAALEWLSQSPAQSVIVYSAPMDTAWVRQAAGPALLNVPARFSKILAEEAVRYPKITFVDLYPDGVPGLVPELHYHDFVHLNQAGAEIFSHYMGKKLAGKIPNP